jgi:hypothetical protein
MTGALTRSWVVVYLQTALTEAVTRRRRRVVWTKRIKDIVAMLLIGAGALTLIGARERALVWRFGPEGLRKSTSWQVEHPSLMRLEGLASIGLGVLLAPRQYREPPRS